jgi:hypothetical protein
MSDAEVINVGVDSGGRPLLMTRYMWAWWQGVLRHLDFKPTIVQGAWMSRNGGGASASEGFHNFGGCLDLRTWDRTLEQQLQLIRVLRLGGAAAWRRTTAQGFDEHIHLVLGSDPGIGANAAQQWRNYLDGDAGLDGPQRDNEWRPDPIVTTPPRDYMEEDWFEMASKEDLRDVVREELAKLELAEQVVKTDTGLRTLTLRQLRREVWQKLAKG